MNNNYGKRENCYSRGRSWSTRAAEGIQSPWSSWKTRISLFLPIPQLFSCWEWCPEQSHIPWLLALGLWARLGGSRGRSSSWTFSSPPFLQIMKSRNTILGHSCYRPHVICCWPSIETSLSRGWWFLRSWIISFAGFKGKKKNHRAYLLIRI